MSTNGNSSSEHSLVQEQSEAEEDLFVHHILTRIQHLMLVDDNLTCISLCFTALENLPQLIPKVEDSLTLSLRNFGENVDDEDDEEKTTLINYYHRALCNYPDSELLRNNLAGFLFKIGHPEIAIQHLRSILHHNPGYLKARENLENIYGFLVERWHFRMLNDKVRNSCFQSAVRNVVQELTARASNVPLVLDIGAGTGLLSMFAASASENLEMFGCEVSPTMYEICCKVLEANRLNQRIQVINKTSASLSIPLDLPRKADLIVTETFDCAFFGEHIVESLIHAWDNLMDEKCCVIPSKATIYVAAVECAAIRRQNRLLSQRSNCIDLSCIEILCTTGNDNLYQVYRSLCDESKVDCCIVEPADRDFEPYSSEFLKRIPGGYRLLSQPFVLTEFALDNCQQVKSFEDGIEKRIELKVTDCGLLDAFIVWFDLHLDGKHVLTTSPDVEVIPRVEDCQPAACWEQAVFPFISNHLYPSQVTFSDDVEVVVGSNLAINMRIDDRLRITCRGIIPPSNDAANTDNGKAENLDQFTEEICDVDNSSLCSNGFSEGGEIAGCSVAENSVPKVVLFMDGTRLSAINDSIYHEACFNAISKVKESLISEGTVLRLVAFLSDSLFLPLGALKWFEKVLTIGLDEPGQTALQRTMSCSGFSSDRLQFNSGVVTEIDRNWSVIFADVVDANGCLRENIFADIAVAKSSRLLPNGIVIPGRVVVYGQLINSSSLREESTVLGDRQTQPFLVADFINEYQSSNHIGFDLSTLEFSAVSNAFQMFSFDLNSRQFSTDSSSSNCWKSCERSFTVTALHSAEVTALVYWFELDLAEDLKIDTRDERCHWKQAAVLFPGAPFVRAGDNINVKAICSDGYFSVDLQIQDCEGDQKI